MLQYSEFTKRVAGRSGYAWAIHMDALKLRDAGQDVIMLTVGDPDRQHNHEASHGANRPALCGRERRHRARCAGRAVLRTVVPRRPRR